MNNRSVEWELAYLKAKNDLGGSKLEQEFLKLLAQRIPEHARDRIQTRFHEFHQLIRRSQVADLRFLLNKLSGKSGLASLFKLELATSFRKRLLSEINVVLAKSKSINRPVKNDISKGERGTSGTSRGTEGRGTTIQGISGGGTIKPVAKPEETIITKTGIPFDWPTIPGSTEVDKKPGKGKGTLLTRVILQSASVFTFGIVVSRSALLGASTLVTEKAFEEILSKAFDTWEEKSKDRLNKELEKWKRARGKKIRESLIRTIAGVINTPIGRIAEQMAIRKLIGLSQRVTDLNDIKSSFPALDLLANEVPIQVKAFGTYSQETFEYNKRNKIFRIKGATSVQLSTLQSYATAFEVFLIPNPHIKSLNALNDGAMRLLKVKGLPSYVTDFVSCLNWIRNSAALMVPDDHVAPLKKLLLKRLMKKTVLIQGIKGLSKKKRIALIQKHLDQRIRGIGIRSKALQLAANVLLNNDLIKRAAVRHMLEEAVKPRKRP